MNADDLDQMCVCGHPRAEHGLHRRGGPCIKVNEHGSWADNCQRFRAPVELDGLVLPAFLEDFVPEVDD